MPVLCHHGTGDLGHDLQVHAQRSAYSCEKGPECGPDHSLLNWSVRVLDVRSDCMHDVLTWHHLQDELTLEGIRQFYVAIETPSGIDPQRGLDDTITSPPC